MTEDEYQIAKMEYLLEWEGWSLDGPLPDANEDDEAYHAQEDPEDMELGK